MYRIVKIYVKRRSFILKDCDFDNIHSMKVGFSLIWESDDKPVGQTVIYQLMNAFLMKAK